MKQIDMFVKTSKLSEEPLPYKRVRREDFDFKGVLASSYVYNIHPYPAMFHFMLVRKLIAEYSNPNDTILDPFMGSGVVCVESIISGRRFIGYDINPLAVLITKVRATILNYQEANKAIERTVKRTEVVKAKIPKFNNIDYWFTGDVKEKLAALLQSIRQERDKEIRDFLKVAFSETVRRVSNAEFNEFKLVRKKDLKSESNVFEVFRTIAIRNLKHLKLFYDMYPQKASFEIKTIDISKGIPLPDKCVDLVITSPPYGDSRTTVAYGQFSRLSLHWLGLEERVDKESLGSKRRRIEEGLPSKVLYEYLSRISSQDEKRAEEVFSFYYDLNKAIKEIARVVKPNGRVCFVVGNRRVKGLELPTDKISADLFQFLGFEHEVTYLREISNKRMPIENSPSNIPGMKDTTMRYEYIVILKNKNS